MEASSSTSGRPLPGPIPPGSRPAFPSRAFSSRIWPDRPGILILGLFYAAYVLGGGWGQGLTIIPGVAVSFWPPAGIFVATLLLTPQATWPWWVLAGALAELTCNVLWFHNPILPALGYFSANALEALTAAALIKWVTGAPFRLESIKEVAALVVLGAGIAPLVGATIGCAIAELVSKLPFATAWPLWWLGDGSGLLVSTPIAVTAVRAWRERTRISGARFIEAAVTGLVLLVLEAWSLNSHLAIAYLTLPALLWAAVRFQFLGAATALGLATLLAAFFTANGLGRFGGDPALLHGQIVMLQAYLGISAISTLLVAALSSEHQQTLLGLEARIAERTADLRESEERLRFSLHAASAGSWDWDIRSDRISWSPENYALHDLEPGSTVLSRADWGARVHPDDRAPTDQVVRDVMSGRATEFKAEYRVVCRDGSVRWLAGLGRLERAADGEPLHMSGINIDITERKRQEEHQKMLMHELDHRVKNTLATIQSIAMQTLRTSRDLPEARQRFDARLLALSEAHDILTREKWEGASLAEVVRRAVAPYRSDGRDRFRVEGPPVRVSARKTVALAMALHELCTNAVKYGALSNDAGVVTIAWSFSGRHEDRLRLELRWSETDGPPVEPPSRRGFGSRLIERSLADDFGGDARLDFARSGVNCTITIPLPEDGAST